jgi:hypothetical protein
MTNTVIFPKNIIFVNYFTQSDLQYKACELTTVQLNCISVNNKTNYKHDKPWE